jgi:hypothetical protein
LRRSISSFNRRVKTALSAARPAFAPVSGGKLDPDVLTVLSIANDPNAQVYVQGKGRLGRPRHALWLRFPCVSKGRRGSRRLTRPPVGSPSRTIEAAWREAMRVLVLASALALAAASSAGAQTAAGGAGPSEAQIRELLDAAKATAKATRENVDYARVTPDLLFQILAKLDKIEDKLDKVENAVKAETEARKRAR